VIRSTVAARRAVVNICQRLMEVRLPDIRRAELRDAGRLSAIAEETFRDTFAPMNTAEGMDLHCQSRFGETIQAQELTNPNMAIFLCEEGARLVGFAHLRWGAVPSCVIADAPGEIWRLYVVRDFQGQGVAHQLMDACLKEMNSRQSDVVWLGVWEHNSKAIAFYKKCGFVEVGEHVFALGSDEQRDIVMSRPVADPPADTRVPPGYVEFR
jgi:diamine N-acetyltransferase